MSDTYQFVLDRKRGLALAGCFIAAALLLFLAGTLTGMLVSNNRIAALATETKSPVAKVSPPKQPELPQLLAPAPTPVTASTQTPSEPVSTTAAPTSAAQPGQPGSAINTPLTQPSVTPSSQSSVTTSAQPSIAEKGSLPSPIPTVDATVAKASPASVPSTGSGSPQTATAAIAPAQTPQLPGNLVSSHPVLTSSAVPLAVKVGSFTVKSNADALLVSLNDLGYRPVMSQFEDAHGRQWYLVKLGPYKRWNIASAVAARIAISENVRPIIGPMQ